MRRVIGAMLASLILAVAPSQAVFAAEGYAASGTVNRVDVQAAQVNITHGPIAGLGWPGMTMSFPVKDRGVLRQLRPGERVAFRLSQQHGRYVITEIAPATR